MANSVDRDLSLPLQGAAVAENYLYPDLRTPCVQNTWVLASREGCSIAEFGEQAEIGASDNHSCYALHNLRDVGRSCAKVHETCPQTGNTVHSSRPE